jgi:LL-diaminopimelate aminotransferase
MTTTAGGHAQSTSGEQTPPSSEPFAPSHRLRGVRTYTLARVFAARDAKAREGVDVIDFGVGNPDMRPAPHVIRAMHAALDDTTRENHRYPQFSGLPEFREAIAAWYQRRFGVRLDPGTEILPLVGSKEGLAHFFLGHLNPGDTVLLATPCYPAYLGSLALAEVNLHEVCIDPVTGELDLEAVPADVLRAARFLMINYPNNPTGAVESEDLYNRIAAFAEKNNLAVLSDIAYCDLAVDPTYRARSFLQHDPGFTRSVEFHSFSKTHSMPGWRVGFMAGNATAIKQTYQVKTNTDFSIFMAIQRAAIAALDSPPEVLEGLTNIYRRRHDTFFREIARLGWDFPRPRATMYVWMPIPRGYSSSEQFTSDLLDATGIVVAPGSGFGRFGEGYVRLSLTVSEERIREAVRRMEAAGFTRDGGPVRIHASSGGA